MAQWKNGPKHTNQSILFIATTIQHLEYLIKNHLSMDVERNFLLWILFDNNPRRDAYLQATNITKTTEFTAKLPEGLINENMWEKLVSNLSMLNACLFSQVVSDN